MKNKIILCLLLLLFVFLLLNNVNKINNYEETDSYGLDIEDIQIEIDGLKKDYNILYMTDNQANFDEREDIGWFGTKTNRTFTDDNGISAADNMWRWFSYANTNKVDAMVMGGDILDYFTEKNAIVLQECLDGLQVPYIYTYGNHDSYVPWDFKFDDDNQYFLNLFDGNDCEFQKLNMGEFYIVSIRNYAQDGTANISQKALEEFKKIYKENKPILLVIHVPIFTEKTQDLKDLVIQNFGDVFKLYDTGTEIQVEQSLLMGVDCGYMLTSETSEFLNMVLDEDGPVKCVISGHLHFSWEGFINENTIQYVGNPAYLNKGVILNVSGE